MPPAGATAPRSLSRAQDLTARLRRLTLDRQGLLRRAPFGRGRDGVQRAVERLGYVQIDTISVVSRAHDHVLQVRLPGYRTAHLDRLQTEGRIFEYWAHAAAYLPMRDYRHAIPRMQAMRARRERWIRSHDDDLMAEVLERVRRDGPLQARDFEAPAGRRSGWWDWKPAKRALEQLFMQGDLMVAGRAGFQKIYDLPERVLPPWVDTRPPTRAEHADHLIQRHLDAHGFASVSACVYQRRTPELAAAVQQALEAAANEGALVRWEVPGPERRVYLDPEDLEGRAAPVPARARLLSPFDNVVILRQRTLHLFGFDYQLECYVPAERRRFGYFCLPLLYRDRFVGRADCKAHRRSARLEVKRLVVEHEPWLGRDPGEALHAMAAAVWELAGHTGCDDVSVGEVRPPRWQAPLTRALAQPSP